MRTTYRFREELKRNFQNRLNIDFVRIIFISTEHGVNLYRAMHAFTCSEVDCEFALLSLYKIHRHEIFCAIYRLGARGGFSLRGRFFSKKMTFKSKFRTEF